MSKRYCKMARKANGKIREIKDGQVILELPLPVADVLAGIPEAVEGLSQKAGLMLIGVVIESECEKITGQKKTKNPLRTANWWGCQLSPVYYNSQKVLIDRPRLRGRDNKEMQLSTYKAFQKPKKMKQSVVKQMVLGISSRNYEEAIESFVGGYRIKKSSISRHFVKATVEQMREFMEMDLSGLELCAIFIDGIEFKGQMLVVATGLDKGGKKHSLGYGKGTQRTPQFATITLPCRVRRPNDKGKVESGIKYVKNNFFSGRKFTGCKDVKERLFKWNTKANHRIHGTTRKVPKEVFEKEEKAKLIPLPQEEFKLAKVGTRKVYHDCHIYVDYNYYSVLFSYVGRQVEIELAKKLLKVSYQGREITVHPRLSGRGKFSTKPSHYPIHKRYSDTEYQEKYQAKMAHIGRYTEQLFFLVIKEHPRDWSRTVQGILSLGKTYPDEVIEAYCRRALSFEVTRYSVIKNICHNGSYLMPVEFEKEAVYATG